MFQLWDQPNWCAVTVEVSVLVLGLEVTTSVWLLFMGN